MYIKQEDILKATNGGLDIIINYFPNADKRKSFRIRSDDKTPSASLKQLADGNWVVTDWGDDGIPHNGIQICQKEENITFREALVMLAAKYNIGGLSVKKNKAGFESRPATVKEKDGEYFFDIKKEISNSEYSEIFPNYKAETKDRYKKVLELFNVYALKSFTYIKNRTAYITSSNDRYPIFLIEHDEFKKIYQPCNPDKGYRFRYVGKRPKDYINGLSQLHKIAEENKARQEKNWLNEEEGKKHTYKKLESVIITSGERDAYNVAAYGYNVIWLNSETAKLPEKKFKEIKLLVDEIYNLPDIDETGIRQGNKLALQYIEIKTIWLPKYLQNFNDNRGKPRKDFRDFVELYPKYETFNNLYKSAHALKFWDEIKTEKGVKYYYNPEQAFAFLAANGFYRIENKNSKDGFTFVLIEKNIVKNINPNRIKQFILNYLRKNHYPIKLINLIHNSTRQFSESVLIGLPTIKPNFNSFTPKSQFLFFANETWEILANKIVKTKIGTGLNAVWEDELINRNVKRIEPAFKTKLKRDLNYDFEINHTKSNYFSFLINSSRIYWREELEERIEEKLSEKEKKDYLKKNKFNIAGPLLNEFEIEEQKQHLLNKIFSIGYLLHRYKDEARAWCVYAMDNKVSEVGESNGRSGKSFCYKFLRNFIKTVSLSGRNPKLTENPHIYDRVTKYIDFILIDDANQYLNFNFFFGDLTGDMNINPKNNQSYEIDFDNSPKFAITSNYTLRNIDASTNARILYTVFSDYYHEQSQNTDYKFTRKIYDDFGKTLFKKDYTDEEWNADYNFIADCISFYLSVPKAIKLSPPMENINLRNLRTTMGDTFKNWADVYFDEKEGKINELISRTEALNDFKNTTGQNKWTTNKFSKALSAWAKFTDYIIKLNPVELRNSNGRIIRSINGSSTEMIYMQTKNEIENDMPF